MRRFAVELLHLAASLAATMLIAWLATKSYPLGAKTIWFAAQVAIIAITVMSIRPLHDAWNADRGRRKDPLSRE